MIWKTTLATRWVRTLLAPKQEWITLGLFLVWLWLPALTVARQPTDRAQALAVTEGTPNQKESTAPALVGLLEDPKVGVHQATVKDLGRIAPEKRTRFGPSAAAWISEHKWVAVPALNVVLFLSLWSAILWMHPIWINRIAETFRPYAEVSLPVRLGGVKISACNALLINFFQYRRRVLDAWVAQRVATARTSLARNKTVDARKVHISVPVLLDRRTIPSLTGKELRPVFARKRGCLLIWGEGGAGKTSLACQLARWAISDTAATRLADHVMLPVLIEEEFIDSKVADGKLLAEAIRGRLQDLVAEPEPIAGELLLHLLRQRCILVIVDHLSQIGAIREMRSGLSIRISL